MDEFKPYQRTQIAWLRPWQPDVYMAAISISPEDIKAGSPKEGDMIARNPDNHADKWLINAAYVAKNFKQVEV